MWAVNHLNQDNLGSLVMGGLLGPRESDRLGVGPQTLPTFPR